MELTFNKDGNLYVTEFEVTADFNLHLERDKGGKVSFYQRSTNGQYDDIKELEKNIDLVFDYDFTALVYPKYIKIVSEVEPTYAEVVTDGEITEIKSQSKEVEIVSNGTTNISPDAGYSYLSGVSVKVNVPQEGGGGVGDVKYLALGIVNINEGMTIYIPYPSEYKTWYEIGNNRYDIDTSTSGSPIYREEVSSYPLYYDDELTQLVNINDEPKSQDYYIEGYSGGGN